MNFRASLQEGFVLHIRAYRETSALVDVFTKEHGVLRLVARGMKRKSSNKTNIAQFKPLLFSWYGRTELKTLTKVEDVSNNEINFMPLSGDALLKAICLNESIIKLWSHILYTTNHGRVIILTHATVGISNIFIGQKSLTIVLAACG